MLPSKAGLWFACGEKRWLAVLAYAIGVLVILGALATEYLDFIRIKSKSTQ